MSTELKVLMFTDQVNSTANAARRTYVEIQQIAREQDNLTDEVVKQCHGIILKDTGDGHLVQFPSALDAVQSAIVLQRRIAERNATNERTRFDLHVGIDIGESVVLPNGDLRGETINRCARICSLCPAGEVYLSETAADGVSQNNAELAEVGTFSLKGVANETTLFRVAALHIWPEDNNWPRDTLNPFVWRSSITRAEDFFNREREQKMLLAYLRRGQNCQIVGPRHIGKSSLLLQIERAALKQLDGAAVAYLDMEDPSCFSLSGWLSSVGRRFKWFPSTVSLTEFVDRVQQMLSNKICMVLCLDGFDELVERRTEFTRDFYLTLRSCAQGGMSVVTASRRPLHEVTDPSDPTSPFYNTFALLRLGVFATADAEDFTSLHRPGVPAFNAAEKKAILDFAKGHPLALQIGCFHMLESKSRREDLVTAISRATNDAKAYRIFD